jgi:hypothetical protein
MVKARSHKNTLMSRVHFDGRETFFFWKVPEILFNENEFRRNLKSD